MDDFPDPAQDSRLRLQRVQLGSNANDGVRIRIGLVGVLGENAGPFTGQLNREFSNFRSDLDAIKGLLLNRKQFAGPVAPIAVPSIPAWQLAGSPHHHHRHSGSDDNEKGDDAGSGSGSSETEVVTKNSDSSLEIM